MQITTTGNPAKIPPIPVQKQNITSTKNQTKLNLNKHCKRRCGVSIFLKTPLSLGRSVGAGPRRKFDKLFVPALRLTSGVSSAPIRPRPMLFGRHAAVLDRGQRGSVGVAVSAVASAASAPVAVLVWVGVVVGMLADALLLHALVVLTDLLPQLRQLLLHVLFALEGGSLVQIIFFHSFAAGQRLVLSALDLHRVL